MFESVDTDDIELLKQEAKKRGIEFSPNIGVKKLQEKILAYEAIQEQNSNNEEKQKEPELTDEQKAFAEKARLAAEKMFATPKEDVTTEGMTEGAKKAYNIRKANALVRCTVTCIDPSKKDVPGAILGARNSQVPLVKKFVPYDGRITHLPRILLDHLKEKECQTFRIEHLENGDKVRRPVSQKMFSIQELPNMTDEDIKKLANAQKAAGSIEAQKVA